MGWPVVASQTRADRLPDVEPGAGQDRPGQRRSETDAGLVPPGECCQRVFEVGRAGQDGLVVQVPRHDLLGVHAQLDDLEGDPASHRFLLLGSRASATWRCPCSNCFKTLVTSDMA
jgi:hypothetical protein